MKKKYIAPEMEVFEQKMTQPLMTTSLPVVSDEEITSGDMLSPELDIENELFGFGF